MACGGLGEKIPRPVLQGLLATGEQITGEDIMRTSRDVHSTSWIISLIVAGSAILTALAGRFLPHIHACLLGNLRFGFVVVFPEILVITLSAMLVVEAFVRQWNGSKQFGLRDLFMLTTAVAVVLSLLATEQRLAKPAGGLPFGPLWLLPIPAIFGLGCAVYVIPWGAEVALRRLKNSGNAAREQQTLDRQMPDWLSTSDKAFSLANKKKRSRHRKHDHCTPSVTFTRPLGASLGAETLGSASWILPGIFALIALAALLQVLTSWLRG
jgi:hypothetical protein